MKPHVSLAVLVAIVAIENKAPAADTTETYGIGTSDFELYTGLDGLGLDKYEKTVFGNGLVGLGIVDRFSGYVAIWGEANERFGAGEGGASIGILGTPVDTNHFDFDLILDLGYGDGDFTMTPGLELNLDAKPDLALCGLYLRAMEVLSGSEGSIEGEYLFTPTTALTTGVYFTIAEIHQILAEYEMAFHHGNNDLPEGATEVVETGGVALGYNIQVVNSVEIITQVSLNIPNDGEEIAAGFMVGIVATTPSVVD